MSLMQKVCVGLIGGKCSSQSEQRQLKSVQKIGIYVVFENCNYLFLCAALLTSLAASQSPGSILLRILFDK